MIIEILNWLTAYHLQLSTKFGGAVAQFGRASALQAECQEFDPPQLHILLIFNFNKTGKLINIFFVYFIGFIINFEQTLFVPRVNVIDLWQLCKIESTKSGKLQIFLISGQATKGKWWMTW